MHLFMTIPRDGLRQCLPFPARIAGGLNGTYGENRRERHRERKSCNIRDLSRTDAAAQRLQFASRDLRKSAKYGDGEAASTGPTCTRNAFASSRLTLICRAPISAACTSTLSGSCDASVCRAE